MRKITGPGRSWGYTGTHSRILVIPRDRATVSKAEFTAAKSCFYRRGDFRLRKGKKKLARGAGFFCPELKVSEPQV